jgi:hypothetical protein
MFNLLSSTFIKIVITLFLNYHYEFRVNVDFYNSYNDIVFLMVVWFANMSDYNDENDEPTTQKGRFKR